MQASRCSLLKKCNLWLSVLFVVFSCLFSPEVNTFDRVKIDLNTTHDWPLLGTLGRTMPGLIAFLWKIFDCAKKLALLACKVLRSTHISIFITFHLYFSPQDAMKQPSIIKSLNKYIIFTSKAPTHPGNRNVELVEEDKHMVLTFKNQQNCLEAASTSRGTWHLFNVCMKILKISHQSAVASTLCISMISASGASRLNVFIQQTGSVRRFWRQHDVEQTVAHHKKPRPPSSSPAQICFPDLNLTSVKITNKKESIDFDYTSL